MNIYEYDLCNVYKWAYVKSYAMHVHAYEMGYECDRVCVWLGMSWFMLENMREVKGLPLSKERKCHRPLDQWTGKCMTIPRRNNLFHYLFESFSVTGISRKELEYIRMTRSMPYTNFDIEGKGLCKIALGQWMLAAYSFNLDCYNILLENIIDFELIF